MPCAPVLEPNSRPRILTDLEPGSGTVAIMVTASLLEASMEALHLDTAILRALTVVACGAGALVCPHVNDSMFYVVLKSARLPSFRDTARILSLPVSLAGLIASLMAGALAALARYDAAGGSDMQRVALGVLCIWLLVALAVCAPCTCRLRRERSSSIDVQLQEYHQPGGELADTSAGVPR